MYGRAKLYLENGQVIDGYITYFQRTRDPYSSPDHPINTGLPLVSFQMQVLTHTQKEGPPKRRSHPPYPAPGRSRNNPRRRSSTRNYDDR